MPHLHCVAVDCTSDSRKKDPDVSFFQLPKVTSQRKLWLKAVRRDGLTDEIERKLTLNPSADLRHFVICSKHFVDELPTVDNPCPTLFAYNNFKQRTPRKTRNSTIGAGGDDQLPETESESPERKRVRLVRCSEDRSQVCYPYVAGEVEHSYCPVTSDLNEDDSLLSQTIHGHEHLQDHQYGNENHQKYCKEEELQKELLILEEKCQHLSDENTQLREENLKLKTENDKLHCGNVNLRKEFVKNVVKNDESVKHFLGLPSLVFFQSILQLISSYYGKISFWKGTAKFTNKKWQDKQQGKPGAKRKLSITEEFVLVMLKLRLGLDNITLSVLFGISIGQVSNLFSSWISFLCQILEPVIKWPSREKVKKHMPVCFKIKYPNTTSIIDCTEIFIQKPKNCLAQACTWSNYKSHNTLKALVAIQPNGAFTFVSKCWSGNISDRKITIDSKYLDYIMPGDEVMADRGFQIRDLLTAKGAYLNMPPFTSLRKKGTGRVLTSKQIVQTRKIASLRIHVERAIRRLKSFKLLGNVLPLNMKDLSSSILKVAAAFCNFMPPLVKKFQ